MALRRRLAAAIEDERTQPRDLSPIILRLREIAEEIAEMDAAEEPDDLTATFAIPNAPFDPSLI